MCALSIRQEEDGMSFVLEDQEEGTFVVKIPAMGKHNVGKRSGCLLRRHPSGLRPARRHQGPFQF